MLGYSLSSCWSPERHSSGCTDCVASHFIQISTLLLGCAGLYHPTQLSIHYVFCRAKTYFVGSLDWVGWQAGRRTGWGQDWRRWVGDDCLACLLEILSDSEDESNCKLD